MTREPEMVKAYRDTWEARTALILELLAGPVLLARSSSTSVAIVRQISDENIHHVREVMDETFGAENACGIIPFVKTSAVSSPQARTNVLGVLCDYLIWYAKDFTRVKYNQPYKSKTVEDIGEYTRVEFEDGTRRALSREEQRNVHEVLAKGGRLYRQDNIISPGYSDTLSQPFVYRGIAYSPGPTSHWKTTLAGMEALAKKKRLEPPGLSARLCPVLSGLSSYTHRRDVG